MSNGIMMRYTCENYIPVIGQQISPPRVFNKHVQTT